MPLPPIDLTACPVCGAVIPERGAGLETHLGWHMATRTLADWTVPGARGRIMQNAENYVRVDEDDHPTAKLPPYRETVLRRPPVPDVRELKGAELLRALASEIERDLADDEAGE